MTCCPAPLKDTIIARHDETAIDVFCTQKQLEMAERIIMKFGMNVMPFGDTKKSYLIYYNR
jgi:hypothetical protein